MAPAVEIQDIVDLIVDHFVDNIKTWCLDGRLPYRLTYPTSVWLQELKECALINKAFAYSSQKYLFSKIRIKGEYIPEIYNIPVTERTSPARAPVLDKASDRSIDNLLAILDHKSYLATHIHTIDTYSEFGYLVQLHPPLKRLLGKLLSHGNPRNLSIFAQDKHNPKQPLPDYSFQKDIAVHLQVLKCDLMEMIPISFIASNPNLTTLKLADCSGKMDDHYVAGGSRPRLKSLVLEESWSVLESLLGKRGVPTGILSPIDFSHLVNLRLFPSASPEDVRSVQRLLSIAGQSLKTLTMSTFLFEATSYISALDLSACDDLHTARLLAAINDTNSNSDSFHKLNDTLITFPSPNVIRYLDIDVYLGISSTLRGQVYASLSWETLDKRLHHIVSATKANQVVCQVFIRFFRGHLDRTEENMDIATQECQQLVEDLKDKRFQLTSAIPSDRIVFKISHTFDVDYLL
ncbi:hypothetical protein BJ165DRAFT_1448725 [Panaeolus papilionaceus]|nr:hypothetical protein BJ165DRAFT_1448725 [Panaeolus papilionaceus]